MNHVESTSRILAFKTLNRNIDSSFVDWAVEMLEAGYETEHLVILAGESKPFNQFHMHDLVDKVLSELEISYSDREKIIKQYACYLIGCYRNGEVKISDVLKELKEIYIELNFAPYLKEFYLLHFATEDLKAGEEQLYWEGATRENLKSIIDNYFSHFIKLTKE